jgi:hypothetical protein
MLPEATADVVAAGAVVGRLLKDVLRGVSLGRPATGMLFI